VAAGPKKPTLDELEDILKKWVADAKDQIEDRVYSLQFIEKEGLPPLNVDVHTSLDVLVELLQALKALRIRADLRRK
jgi:hypothetical protein